MHDRTMIYSGRDDIVVVVHPSVLTAANESRDAKEREAVFTAQHISASARLQHEVTVPYTTRLPSGILIALIGLTL